MMKDNAKTKGNSKEGIERVKQRKGEMGKGMGGCSGKMGERKGSESNWKVPSSAKTPRRA